MRRRIGILLPALGLFALLALPAQARHIVGIKAAVTNLDVPSLTADMDVTLYTNGSQYGPSSQVGGIPGYPMIDWDDGATLSSTSISAVSSGPPAVYRGSFSHTYAGSGPYTVTVASDCCASYAGGGTITGNRITFDTGLYPYAVITNTTTVDFSSVPAAQWQGLAALAAMMMLAGVYLLRR